MLRPALLVVPLFTAVAADHKIGQHTFTLPDDFVIEAAAGPPLVDRPITMAFDESGSLYVSDSSGSNDKVEKQLADKPHRIVRLVDRDGDGRFDDRTVFADKMMFPEGTMWLDGSLYVSAPPQIWKLTDTNADGIADKREVWFDGKTLTGCANDLHGPYAGLDGFIYWCKGAFAEQRHQLANGRQLVTKASHIFRARPDGTGLENVVTGGMDNPVDVVFTPSGERLLSGTFFLNPRGGQRDGILHAVYGGVFGKDHAVLDGHPRTGDLLPIMTHLGPAAPSGLELLRSPAPGAAWQSNLLACHFNLHKVTRHVLAPDGATFKTQDSDFVVSDQADFHPTDVLEDADGSILIADTGGWYKLCCPTSQLHKPDVLGTIYRVRRKDAPRVDDPRGLQLKWDGLDAAALSARLGDPRPAVADRAMAALAKMGAPAVTAVATWINTSRPGNTDKPSPARLNALWTLTRISGDGARAAVRFAFADKDPAVRVAACHSAGLWRDPGSTEALINQLSHADLQLRRAAAEALGQIADAKAAPALSKSASKNADRFLEHSLAFALIELNAADAARAALSGTTPGAVRVGLAALQQLGKLPPDELLKHLTNKDPETARLAEWIAARHPEWGAALADWLRTSVQSASAEDLPRLGILLKRLAANSAVQALVADLASDTKEGLPPTALKSRRALAFATMRESGLKDLPDPWLAIVEKAIRTNGDDTAGSLSVAQAFSGAKNFPPSLRAALEQLSNTAAAPSAHRVAALVALPGKTIKLNDELLDVLLAEINSADLMRARTATAQVARVELTPYQLATVATFLPKATAIALPTLLEVFRGYKDEPSGRLLVDQISQIPKVPAALVRSILAKYPAGVRDAAESLLAKDIPDNARARLDQLAAELPKGDIRRGHQLFRSTRSACTTCHAMAYVGGNLGPDLTRIGGARTERDLLEAIVYPSASFVRSYESVFVKTRTSADQLGILRKEDAAEIVVASGPGIEARLSREDVTAVEPAPVSLMPQGYDGIFSPQELADLVAFLKAAK